MSDKIRRITDRIELRPVVMPNDEEFLQNLYCTSRQDFDHLPFDEAGKRAFMMMQYNLQKAHYAEYFTDADHDIVLFDGEQVGRYMIEPRDLEVIGVDMAILPAYRNYGIGTALLNSTMEFCKDVDLPFLFHVVKDNTNAIRLYKRLGCKFAGESDMHYKLRWLGEDAAGATGE